MGNVYVYFLTIFVIVIFFEYDFCTKDHINCDIDDERKEYTDLFCMSKTQNLRSLFHDAHLKTYGRWQFYIIIQMFIAAVCCRIDLKIRQLERDEDRRQTIGKRYILTMCILLSIIVCWTLTYFSLGGHFNSYVGNVIYHSIDVREVPSPVATAFPLKAQCLVESKSSNETYTATCNLPLNSATPFYYLVLFFAYVLGLMHCLNCVLSLVWEKIQETGRCRRMRQIEIQLVEEAKVPEHTVRDEGVERNPKWESLDKILARFVKNLTKPQSNSLSKEPLIANNV